MYLKSIAIGVVLGFAAWLILKCAMIWKDAGKDD